MSIHKHVNTLPKKQENTQKHTNMSPKCVMKTEKTPLGATHIRFVYSDDEIPSHKPKKLVIVNTKHSQYGGNYIDARCRYLDNMSVYYALEEYYYVNAKNVTKKYKMRDLLYDINTGRIMVCSEV